MYEYYYNFLKPKYGDKIRLIYTDTDSFILYVETDDFYADMKENLERYDTSDYPEDNKFQMPRVNKKVPGLFSDELKGEIIAEFAGLRSKMYCVRIDATDEKNPDGIDKMKKAKGVKGNVVKNHIKFEDYKSCLAKHSIIIRDQTSFRTKQHQMYTIQQTKIALSPDDDKRHILRCRECKTGSCDACNFQTLPHGHYKIKQLKENDADISEQIDAEIKKQKIIAKNPEKAEKAEKAKKEREEKRQKKRSRADAAVTNGADEEPEAKRLRADPGVSN